MTRWIAAALLAGLCMGQAWAAPPNVLLILADDLGWGDLSANGGAGVPTPRLDQLAREGTRFTRFYVASPICSPSRCGIITGQYPGRWRITSFLQTRAGNQACEQADFLDPKAPSFVRAFREAGYATAHIGKWHLGGGRDVENPPKFRDYGYDLGLGTYESPEPAAELGLKTTPWGAQVEPQQVQRHDRTRWMVDQTLEFARRNSNKPWLVNLWLDDVHTPYTPSEKQKEGEIPGIGTDVFRAVLHETDRQMGRLFDGLRDLKVDANTIVIFIGDNGPAPSFDRARTGGLRGMKLSLYEGGIRTPCIVRWPGKVAAQAVNDQTAFAAVDFFPTLCVLAGVKPPDGVSFDGEDLSDVLRGRSRVRSKPLFWEYGRPAKNGAKTAFRYPPDPGDVSPHLAIMEGNWKLLINPDGSGAQLYDLSRDPKETQNLASFHPEQAKRLSESLLAWRRSLP